MSKKRTYNSQTNANQDVSLLRSMLTNRYMEKARTIWMSSYKWEGLPLATSQYIMRKLWETGNVAAFAYEVDLERKIVDFLPWAMSDYNSHRDPARIRLINENNAKNVPAGLLEVVYDETIQLANENKKATICYAQSNRESIYSLAKDYVNLIVRVEMTMNTALIAAKQPFLVTFDPDEKDQSNDFQKRLMNDDPILFSSAKLVGFGGGQNYIIDKLYQLKTQRENEFLTYLGIDNAPIQKKERETVDEANSNNDLINDHEASINENLREFVRLTNATFGTQIKISSRHAESASVHDKQEGGPKDGNED